MAKKRKSGFVGRAFMFLISLVGILASLAIGFAMIGEVLTVPFIPLLAMKIAGWIIVGSTILATIFGLIKVFTK